MKRQTMGPRASEPEQRDYAITITAPDGTSTSAGIVRSHHALDAAREAAAARDLGEIVRESAVNTSTWAVTTGSGHVVRAQIDTPHARASVLRSRPIAASPTNDERAATQRRIADAIRSVPEDVARAFADVLCSCERDANNREERNTFFVLGALAAAARDDRVADALAQVRQAIVLDRFSTIREDNPTEGG